MSIHKKQLINEVCKQLQSYGYKVFISKTLEYGFYTDGKRVVCFGGCWNFSVDFSGNYKCATANIGSGWQIAKDMGIPSKEEAELFITAYAPMWATNGNAVTYTTPEQHLKLYGVSSGYVEFIDNDG